MKILTNKSYPYPVLGRQGDIAGEYDVEMVATSVTEKDGGHFYNFKIKHHLVEKTIEKLIQDDKACFCVDIQCESTIYRSTHNSKSEIQEIIISADDVSEEVAIQFFIVATSPIIQYKSLNFNDEYLDNGFDLDAGDILAFTNEKIFWAEKIFQSTKLVKNFFVVVDNPNGGKAEPIEIGFDNQKIIIYMSHEDHKKFDYFGKNQFVPAIYHSSLVFPVLNYVLSYINQSSEQPKYSWYKMLKHKIKRDEKLSNYYNEETDSLDFQVGDIPKISQLIMRLPFSRQLISIEGLIPLATKESINEQYNET
jgi:hypothetical protein